LGLSLRAGTAFGDPLAQLFRANRTVWLAIRTDDFEH
jgi:hypothetical protein